MTLFSKPHHHADYVVWLVGLPRRFHADLPAPSTSPFGGRCLEVDPAWREGERAAGGFSLGHKTTSTKAGAFICFREPCGALAGAALKGVVATRNASLTRRARSEDVPAEIVA